jgi:NADH-quinone oxidoreductase subunit C
MKRFEEIVPVIESSNKGLNSYYYIAIEDLEEAAKFFHTEGARISTISGLDARDHLEVLYHFAIWGNIYTVIVKIPYEKPEIPTITNYFEGAILYERELIGLLGINVKDIPDPRPLEIPPNYTDKLPPLRRA